METPRRSLLKRLWTLRLRLLEHLGVRCVQSVRTGGAEPCASCYDPLGHKQQ